MDRKLLIHGWYGHQNIGDEAFRDSFRALFPAPEYTLKFTDQLPSDTSQYDALIVGGGSFLDQPIRRIDQVKIPMAFVGVGLDGIHPDNQKALDRARIVVARNKSKYIYCPDLVFAQDVPPKADKPEIISVMVNNHFCPDSNSPPYKAAAWEWFCVEFSQTLDRLISQYQCPVWFLPMCTHHQVDDRRAAAYVIDRMKYREWAFHVMEDMHRDDIVDAIGRSHMLISQRFHGLVFSAMSGIPFIAIDGHSKMKNLVELLGYEASVDYYGYSMSAFWEAMSRSKDTQAFAPYVQKAKKEWADMSVAIKTALFG